MDSRPSRAFCLTIQTPIEDPDWDDLDSIVGGSLRFVVWQLEQAPTTGQLHLQVYLEFSKPVRPSVFKLFCAREVDEPLYEQSTWCSGFHVEPRRASREAARQYCEVAEWKGESKGRVEGPWYWPSLAAWDQGGQGKRSDLSSACALLKSGGSLVDVARTQPETFVRFERGLSRLADILSPSDFREVEGWFIWGDTGVGKSHWVYSTFGPANVYSPPSESPLWFDGYRGQSVLFFEEFDSAVPIKTLLRIVDEYSLAVQVKGGFVNARWTRVIFTGNSDITRGWPRELMRRFGFGSRVRHVGVRDGERVGFPTAAEVGGAGGFSMVKRRHVVAPRPDAVPGADAPGIAAGDGHVAAVQPGPPGPMVGDGGVRILPNFVVDDGGVVRHRPVYG